MSGVEAIPLIILGVELLVKGIQKAIEKAEENKQLKKTASYFYNYAVSIDKSTLKTLARRADIVVHNPMVTDEDKERLKNIMDAVNNSLKEIEAALGLYPKASSMPFSREKKKHLTTLETASRHLKDEFEKFFLMLASQEELTKTSEHLLQTYDCVVRPDAVKTSIADSTCLVTGRLSRPINGLEAGEQILLLEAWRYGRTKKAREDARVNVTVLNQHLAAAEHTKGIPKVLGFREEEDEDGQGAGQFHLVMWLPNMTTSAASKLATLRGSFSSASDMPALNDRIDLCAALAEAVLHVHRLGLVHKNIRPESVLLVPDTDADANKRTSAIDAKPYLVDWQLARQTHGYQTLKVGEDAWERGIYQHPKRHGTHAESEYCMGHDIYSLGVCMLEILCWRPLVEKSQDADSEPLLGKAFNDAFSALNLGGLENRESFNSEAEWITNDPQNVKSTLLKMVNTHIPAVAGKRMAATITRCLNCLDGSGDDSEHDQSMKEYLERNPKEVGANFVDDILTEIQGVACSI